MLKQANKWIKDSFKPYKYEDQKTKDKLHLIDGIVDTVVGCATNKNINDIMKLQINQACYHYD